MVEGKFRLRQIGIEDDVVDMAAIGKQNGSVELYATEENNIAFLDGEFSKGDNEDSEVDSGSSDSEGFHDSDYDFSKDDENLIYNEFAANIDGDLNNHRSPEQVGHVEQRTEEHELHEPHEHRQEHTHVKATVTTVVNIFDGEQIPVNEESDSFNSDELNSIYGSSNEDVRQTSKFVRFKPEIEMENPNFYVGLQFSG
ncbi:hypothetical protein ACH5RR_037723 [Cinchona calisaya]|uniref:Uncharacterized protein n=1 Tax=Cinchona calisaya TaxID=153742 RepID=A0ABD2YAP8_9GENT